MFVKPFEHLLLEVSDFRCWHDPVEADMGEIGGVVSAAVLRLAEEVDLRQPGMRVRATLRSEAAE